MDGRSGSNNNNNNNNNNDGDDNKRNDEKMPVNKLALYGRNVKGTFFKGYLSIAGEGSYAALLANAFHTLLLPLSLTVGAGTKTIVDIATREPLTMGQMQAVLVQVQNMNDQDFDALVNAILAYGAKSDSSHKLKSALKWDVNAEKQEADREREELTGKKKREIIQAKFPDFNHQQIHAILPLTPVEFTAEQTEEINNAVAKSTNGRKNAFRVSQRTAIVNYLKDEMNAGKKMEQVIHDNALKCAPK